MSSMTVQQPTDAHAIQRMRVVQAETTERHPDTYTRRHQPKCRCGRCARRRAVSLAREVAR